MTGTYDGYQRTENHGKDDGEEGDDERIAQSLQEILIAVVIDEARLELIQKSMLCTSYFCIFGIHHDDLSHIGVGIGESDVLLSHHLGSDDGATSELPTDGIAAFLALVHHFSDDVLG